MRGHVSEAGEKTGRDLQLWRVQPPNTYTSAGTFGMP